MSSEIYTNCLYNNANYRNAAISCIMVTKYLPAFVLFLHNMTTLLRQSTEINIGRLSRSFSATLSPVWRGLRCGAVSVVALSPVWRCLRCGAVSSVALSPMWRCLQCGAVSVVARSPVRRCLGHDVGRLGRRYC